MNYCENCGQDNLTDYVIDGYGSLFCSEKCFIDSARYRPIKLSETPLAFFENSIEVIK